MFNYITSVSQLICWGRLHEFHFSIPIYPELNPQIVMSFNYLIHCLNKQVGSHIGVTYLSHSFHSVGYLNHQLFGSNCMDSKDLKKISKKKKGKRRRSRESWRERHTRSSQLGLHEPLPILVYLSEITETHSSFHIY